MDVADIVNSIGRPKAATQPVLTADAQLVPGMSFADYTAMDAVNVSTLLHFYGRTDLAARARIEAPRTETDSFLIGHALHAAILEPAVFEAMYSTMPPFPDLRTKAGREARDKWLTEHADTANLTTEQYAAVLAMRESVRTSTDSEIRGLLDGAGQNELTATWTDGATGLKCKARIDRQTVWRGYPTILDLKTDRDISDRGVETAISKYNYHVRLAWYMDALSLVKPAHWRAVYLWISNEPPYECRATECDDHAYDEGRKAYRALLDRYAHCRTTGEWASYTPGIQVINPARWAYRYTTPERD